MAFFMPAVKKQFNFASNNNTSPGNSAPTSRRTSQTAGPTIINSTTSDKKNSDSRSGFSQNRPRCVSVPIAIVTHEKSNLSLPSSPLTGQNRHRKTSEQVSGSPSFHDHNKRAVVFAKPGSTIPSTAENKPVKSILVRSTANHETQSSSSSLSASPRSTSGFENQNRKPQHQQQIRSGNSSLSTSPVATNILEDRVKSDEESEKIASSAYCENLVPRPRSVSYNKVVEVFDTEDNRKFHTVLVDKLNRQISNDYSDQEHKS